MPSEAETGAKRKPACMTFPQKIITQAERQTSRGGLPERIIGADCKSADGVRSTVRPFESDTRRHCWLKLSPVCGRKQIISRPIRVGQLRLGNGRLDLFGFFAVEANADLEVFGFAFWQHRPAHFLFHIYWYQKVFDTNITFWYQ